MLSSILFGQADITLRHSSDEVYDYDYHIYMKDKSIKYEDTLTYFWFKSQKIHSSQGNAGGKVLHGDYLAYYKNGQLAMRGQFEKGLKEGEWKEWREDGSIKRICTYSNGSLHGDFCEFDETGNTVHDGVYKKGIEKEKGSESKNVDEKEKEEIEEEGFFKRIFKKEEKNDDSELDGEPVEAPEEVTNGEKQGFFKSIFKKKEITEDTEWDAEPVEVPVEVTDEDKDEEKEGFFKRLFKKKDKPEKEKKEKKKKED